MPYQKQLATLACLLDVTVPKPGNVHRGADFEDTTFLDFVLSASAIGPVMEAAPSQSIGRTVLDAIRETRKVTQANTNLGIVLLLGPIAKAAPSICSGMDGRSAVGEQLRNLNAEDAKLVYEAIRLANPGGLKKTNEMDVNDAAPSNLLDAMSLASEWDLVAKQYVSDFADVFSLTESLVGNVDEHGITDGVVLTFLELLSQHPDSLIQRKCGPELAQESAARAGDVLDAFHATGKTTSEEYLSALSDLDFWLRSDGNRRNPGTSADAITASIFLALLGKSLRFR